MPVFGVDDQACFNTKVLRAGNEAFGAWCRAGSWSMANLTDGHVTRDVTRLIAPDGVWVALRDCGLPGAGLVEETEDGWQIHDWDHWQTSADEIRKRRQQQALRQQNHRAAKRCAPRVTHAVTHAVTRDVPRESHSESRPPLPLPLPLKEENKIMPNVTRDNQRDNQRDSEEASKALSLEPLTSKRDDAHEVFEHWRSAYMPAGKELPARTKRIKARLAEGYTVDQLKSAIDGARKDDWLMGRDPKSNGRKYTDLDTLLRDGAQVERLIELHAYVEPADPLWPDHRGHGVELDDDGWNPSMIGKPCAPPPEFEVMVKKLAASMRGES